MHKLWNTCQLPNYNERDVVTLLSYKPLNAEPA